VVSTDFEVFSKIKKGEYRSLPMSTSGDLRDIVKQQKNSSYIRKFKKSYDVL